MLWSMMMIPCASWARECLEDVGTDICMRLSDRSLEEARCGTATDSRPGDQRRGHAYEQLGICPSLDRHARESVYLIISGFSAEANATEPGRSSADALGRQIRLRQPINRCGRSLCAQA
jgi:hypothetical protein